VVAGLVIVALAGCAGGRSVNAGGGGVPAPATTTTAVPRTADSTAAVRLTAADQGTVTASVGQRIELSLVTASLQWSPITVTPAGLLRPDPVPSPPLHGRVAIWTAVQPGTARVTAAGTAVCAAATPCPLFARLFSVTIVIS